MPKKKLLFSSILENGVVKSIQPSNYLEEILERHKNYVEPVEITEYMNELKEKHDRQKHLNKIDKNFIYNEFMSFSIKIEYALHNYFEGHFSFGLKKIPIHFSVEHDEIKFHYDLDEKYLKFLNKFITCLKKELIGSAV